MEIKEITDQKTWDNFIVTFPEYTFLQGWNWGEINLTTGEKVWRLGIFKDKKMVGVCQVFFVSAKRGKFLFVPHGPLFKNFSSSNFKFLLNYLKVLAKKNNCSFIRISPFIEATDKNKKIFKNLGFKSSPTIMHAEETWLININQDEKEILSQMRKTTRNLISRAQRENVEIIKSNNVKDIKYLYDLQIKTSIRSNFVPFPQNLLEKELEIFSKDNQCLLFLGKHNNEILAAAIIVFFGKFAYYYQSGSQESKVPVNYLLQWEVIREAKSRGCEIYNMWGIAPFDQPNHRFYKLNTFKTGFGGYDKNYLHAQDLPLSLKYWLTYFIEKIPKTLRAKIHI